MFDIQISITGYILGKVAKLHFLEIAQKSLKTRQHSYQKTVRQENEELGFFDCSFFKITIVVILNF